MIKALLAVLRKSWNVQSNAQQSLIFAIIMYIKSEKRKASPVLLESFKKSSEAIEFRMFLGELLSNMNPNAAKDTFKQVMADPNQPTAIRAQSAYCLGFADGHDIPNLLAALILDPNQLPEVQAGAVAGLTAYYQHSPYIPNTQPGVLSALSLAARSPNDVVSIRAIRTLGYLHSEEVLVPLLNRPVAF